jgi:hypothetical protein
MANFHNHPRIRRRNYEYPRLIPSDIKKYMSAPNGCRHPLSWSINGKLVLELDATTTPYGLDLKGSNGFQQLIPTTWTKLKNGSRQWWLCPECGRRCGVLYFDNGFGCRHCIKPAYECQNGSRTDYLARKIRELRAKAFKQSESDHDLLESSHTMPDGVPLIKNKRVKVQQRIQALQSELMFSFKHGGF